jgi:hypothetical protein
LVHVVSSADPASGWKSSIPISAGVCMFQPGSVKTTGAIQFHRDAIAWSPRCLRQLPAYTAEERSLNVERET